MNAEIELEKSHNLARKSIWATATLSFFIPIAGYIYTGRYKQMLIGFAIAVGFMGCAIAGDPSLEDDDEFLESFGFICMIAAAIDNSKAVHDAKERTKKRKSSRSNTSRGSDNLEMQLLKLLKRKNEVTTADCVIETGCSAKEIRQTFEKLQQDELVTISNRSSDGAITYRII